MHYKMNQERQKQTWMNGFPPISFNGVVDIPAREESKSKRKNMVYTVDETIKRNNDFVIRMLTLL